LRYIIDKIDRAIYLQSFNYDKLMLLAFRREKGVCKRRKRGKRWNASKRWLRVQPCLLIA